MRNFPCVVDESTSSTSSTLVTTVSVRSVPSASRLHLLTEAERWEWQHLRDFVVAEIQARRGAQTYDPTKLVGIFKSFAKRWGSDAGPISRYIFDVCDGFWLGKAVTVNSWCKATDPYFAKPIAERLEEIRNYR